VKVLHVLYQSYPNISGSSTRSRSIVRAQKSLGIEPIVITSPFQEGEFVNTGVEKIDGIKYYRCFLNDGSFSLGKSKTILTRLRKLLSIISFTKKIYQVASDNEVSIIHSHAMFFNAIPSYIVSRILSIPHVYEIRSDWSSNSNFSASKTIKYLMQAIERFSVKRADKLVVISQGLFDKYSKYNNNLAVVPNAVSNELIVQGMDVPDANFVGTLNLLYVGSIIELEGLSFVIEAVSKAPDRDYSLTIVGDGKLLGELKLLVSNLNLDNVNFIGKVKPEEVSDYYITNDVVINYRKDEPVAHTVTPLKPLEAMAFKRLVVASNVGGMKELISNNVTGVLVAPNNPGELLTTLELIRNNSKKYKKIAASGQAFVASEKSWISNAEKYKQIYTTLATKERRCASNF